MGRRPPTADLAPREREIFEIVFRLKAATAEEVRGHLQDPPGNSSVRKMLALLEAKEFVFHIEDGPRFLYLPTLDRAQTRTGALHHLIQTFFGGSPTSLVTTLLRDPQLSAKELAQIDSLIHEATTPEAE